MLNKTFTLASVVSLAGAVLWMTATAACGGDETNPSSASSSGTSGDDGGGSSSGDPGTSSGSTSSGSSGDPFADAGLKDPSQVEGVDVTYGECEAFTKCGGSIEGSWDITGGCLDKSTFDGFRDAAKCPGIQEHDVVIKASGSVLATASEVTQKTSLFLSAKIDIPKSCPLVALALQQSGGCAGLNSLLTSGSGPAQFDHALCTDDGEFCKCAADATVDEPGKVADPYVTDGTGTLTTKPKDAPERNYDYCPKDSKITYRETTKDNKSFGMFLTITKK